MVTPPPPRKPRFFWQGTLILLPVLVLAAVSAVSLWQDEQLAEQDARNRAAKNVQSLGQAMRSEVDAELQRYVRLEGEWAEGLRSASVGSLRQDFPPDDVLTWEKDHPGMAFGDLATIPVKMGPDGRQIDPPAIAGAPEPPKWFQELTPLQSLAWQRLRRAADDQFHANETNPAVRSSDPNTLVKAAQADFLKSNPSGEARKAAQYVTYPPELLIEHDTNSHPTESGITFEALACYRLLTRAGTRLRDPLLNEVWHQSFDPPSFVAPRLLYLAEALTNGLQPTSEIPMPLEKVHRMSEFWTLQVRTAQAMETLRLSPDFRPGKPQWWSQWFEGGRMLVIFKPGIFDPRMVALGVVSFKPDPGIDLTNWQSGGGYEVSFVPRAILEGIFEQALSDNKYLVPEYASLGVAVAGVPFRQPAAGVSTDEKNLLGEAEQTAGNNLGQDAGDIIHFDVKFFLASRGLMLATEQRRIKLFGALILGTLLTALAGLLAARRAFYRQLEVNAMKSNFVSSVSHELRAPIASVRLMAENLEHGKIPGPARQNEYFHFIVQECRRLSSLIENVLDFSRIEQGRKQYDFEPTDLAALTRTTVKLMEPYAAEKGVKLELLNGVEEQLEAMVDGRAIQQALVNLIDNAVKHSAKGKVVTITNERVSKPVGETDGGLTGGVIRISVADQGPGIPVAEREKIFERFYRTGSELRRETQGVGIGLSIVKHIVEAHGGRIQVESESGQGSRFIIGLPVGKENELK